MFPAVGPRRSAISFDVSPFRRPLQDGDNAFLKIAFHFCQSERSTIGDIIARPSSANAVNVGDAAPQAHLYDCAFGARRHAMHHGNAYGGLPFELDFSDGPFSSVAAARLSPLTRRGTRVIGADGVSFPSDIARAE